MERDEGGGREEGGGGLIMPRKPVAAVPCHKNQ
jgi:hypothetical protein